MGLSKRSLILLVSTVVVLLACTTEAKEVLVTREPIPTVAPTPDSSDLRAIITINQQWAGIIIAINAGVMTWDEADPEIAKFVEPYPLAKGVWREVLDGTIGAGTFANLIHVYMLAEFRKYLEE